MDFSECEVTAVDSDGFVVEASSSGEKLITGFCITDLWPGQWKVQLRRDPLCWLRRQLKLPVSNRLHVGSLCDECCLMLCKRLCEAL